MRSNQGLILEARKCGFLKQFQRKSWEDDAYNCELEFRRRKEQELAVLLLLSYYDK